MSGRSRDTFHLIQHIIDPVSDLICSQLVCDDVGADQIITGIGAATGEREYVVDIPATIDPLAIPDNVIVRIAISIPVH
jgi:hypothetical protein